MPEQCAMIIGFLVPHRCDNPGLGQCTQCGRVFCDEHVQVTPNGLVCLACRQGLPQPVALPITAQTFSAADIAVFDAASRWDEDDSREMFSDLS